MALFNLLPTSASLKVTFIKETEKKLPGTVGQACNPGTQTPGVGGSSTWGYRVRSYLKKKRKILSWTAWKN